jgi:ATP-dependent RNA helicase HelY
LKPYNYKQNSRRSKPPHRRRRTPMTVSPGLRPNADSRLKSIFAKIGVPEEKPFKPDRFQLEALAAIQETDCLVTAPTGSGKTWIAEEAIAPLHAQGKRVWYASPLKALTNSKYTEFKARFGAENVGILTGDRKENADAPIIVGTTEILRNHLYDVMREGIDFPADLIVLDEAHFLGDPDRGVVWEEVIIYLPQRLNLLMLSATISNADQIADWMESIRHKECVVVDEATRPVPLYSLFLHPSGELLPLTGRKGIARKVERYLNSENPPLLAPPHMLPPFGDIIRVLRKYHLLPAIFFLKSRADCNAALDFCGHAGSSPDLEARLEHRTEELLAKYPYLRNHKQLSYISKARVAAHHAGQLPGWKLFTEKLMTEGLLDAVFATSTVAAGVNFPARTVVFFNSDRFNGHEFVPLDATEFHQMTGRAGRRGMDNIGFALAVPGKFMDVRLVNKLLGAPPEPIFSRITVNFSMVLNLLLSHTPEEVKDVFEKSFATYLNIERQQKGIEKRFHEALEALADFLPKRMCDSPSTGIDLIIKRRMLHTELRGLNRQVRHMSARLSKEGALVPGRLFLDKKKRLYCVIRLPAKKEEGYLCCLMRSGSHRRRPKLRKIALEKVGRIFDKILPLPESRDPYELCSRISFEYGNGEESHFLRNFQLGDKEFVNLKPLIDRVRYLEDELAKMVCNQCAHYKLCHKKGKSHITKLIDDILYMSDSINAVRVRLWNDFQRHLGFLKEEGFVGGNDQLTEDGMWTSQLRLDQPLMIAEGLRLGVFPETDPAFLAALVAPFVYDREIETYVDRAIVPNSVFRAFDKMVEALTPLAERKKVRGFAVRPIPFWAAAAIYSWASGMPWEKVSELFGITDGDLAMLVFRTADNLRQIASLKNVYPGISRTAREAVDIILREPVMID